MAETVRSLCPNASCAWYIVEVENSQEPSDFLTETELRLQEQKNLAAALAKANWKIKGSGGAADLLGVKPTTLISRMKK